MSGVYTSYIVGANGVINQYDKNRDGLNRQEIAKATVDYSKSSDPTYQNTSMLLATFLVGGKDGDGVFYDPNNDGRIQAQEFITLAGLAGNTGAIEGVDLKAAFGEKAGGGNAIDMNKIAAIANGETTSSTEATQSNETPPLDIKKKILNMVMKMLMSLIQNVLMNSQGLPQGSRS